MGKLKKIAAGAAAAGSAYFAVGTYFYHVALRRERKPFLEDNPNLPDGTSGTDHLAEERNQKKTAWRETVETQTVELTSYDDLKLKGRIFLQNLPTRRWAVLVHGYLSNKEAMEELAFQFARFGYNVLTIDCRGCGESEGTHLTMGWKDRIDIHDWCRYLIERDETAEIALYGISMGGAAVMMASGEDLPTNVKCIVEDCGYTSVYDIFRYQLWELFHLPAFPVMDAANTVTKLREGFDLKEASAVRQLRKNKRPILFIHGEQDTFVPYSMLDSLYQADSGGFKEKYVVRDAPHGGAYANDPDKYMDKLMNFLLRAMA